MSRLYLVADDLTGALDSTAAFCRELGPVPVFLGASPENGPGHAAAVDLATRDADATSAVQANLSVLRQLTTADVAFKKIDSLLRGHWAVELAALLRSGSFRTCVLAPAFPAQGRVTVQGRQVVHTSETSSYIVDVDPGARLRQLGLKVHCVSDLGTTAHSALDDATIDVVLADAASDESLRAIAGWGAQRPRPILWCGSAGLARALAQAGEPPQVGPVRRPVLAIVGTDHAVSTAQVARAAASNPECVVVADVDLAVSAARIAQALSRVGHCVLTFALPIGTPPDEAARSIRSRLAALLPQITRPSTLVVTGGETLLSVCQGLGATHLQVDGEFSPGVPHSTLCAGRWHGIDAVSKSGAFGAADWLSDLLAAAH